MKISLAFSTCPNDTFIFDALVNKKIDTKGYEFELHLADIKELNQLAQEQAYDLIKVSYFTFGLIRENYQLLDSGGALGQACGPLLISKKKYSPEQLREMTIAIPGANTTANFLLDYFLPNVKDKKVMLFNEIIPTILNDEADAGVIIHENRFTYQQHGLVNIQDLGDFWEEKTSLPIPLGGIVARKTLGKEAINDLNELVHKSIKFAFDNPESSKEFVKKYAQELDDTVIKSHIDLYVNQHSLSLGLTGKEAVKKLIDIGESKKYFPVCDYELL